MASNNLILIVDDTRANLRLLSHVLEKEGYDLIEAADGETALELTNKHHPDLILLDIMMPGMDGFEVIKRIKQNKKLEDIPIIFLSSLTDTEDKIEAFKAGGVDYITKPFKKEETLARIKTHMHIRTLQQQLSERIKVLRQREKELKKINQQKDDLVRMVSHDIKNPLTGIIGLVKLMRDSDQISKEEQKQMFSVIEESGTNLLNMVREVLDRESKNIENQELEYSNVRMSDLVERVVAINKAKAVTKDIELGYLVNPEALKAQIDAGKVEILMNNLVSNALKFTPSEGRVHVEITKKEDEVMVIEVRDNGIGIPDEMKEDLFKEKTRTSRLGTSGEVGTGLGLDIVQLYVNMHGGKVWVESEIDEGTTFFIKLPLKN